MSDQTFAGIPGEAPNPDPDLVGVIPPVADINAPTGTPMDAAAPDIQVDMADPMAAGLAAFFEHQSKFNHSTPGVETASAAPTASPPTVSTSPSAPTEVAQGGPQPPPTAVPPPLVEEPPSASPPASPTPEPAPAVPPVEPGTEPSADAPPTPPTGPDATPPTVPQPPPASGEITPPGTGTPPAAPWVPAGHVLVGERPIPEGDIPNVLRVYDWARSMPPELAQAIRDLESGNFILAPRHSPQSPQPPQPYGPTASGSGAPSPSPYGAGSSYGAGGEQYSQYPQQPGQEYLDPALAARVDALAQQNAQILQHQQAQEARIQAEQRQSFEAQITAGRSTFQTAMSLSAPEVHYLTDRVAAMGMFNSLVQQHGGNIPAAMNAALEAAYWADPEFRNRHTAAETQSQLNSQLLANQQLEAKKRLAGSLAGSSVPVSRTPPPAAPLTRESATSGMVSEIAAHLQGSSNNGNVN